MENLVKKYLNYNTGNSKQYHKELEVRFGTRGKYITKDQYDNVIKKLQSVGFYLMNTEGSHLLRIMNQYDPNMKQISNIRTEIRNLENIQYYCKHNRIPEKKDAVIFQKKFNDGSSVGTISDLDVLHCCCLQPGLAYAPTKA